jgi:hypothetical protein
MAIRVHEGAQPCGDMQLMQTRNRLRFAEESMAWGLNSRGRKVSNPVNGGLVPEKVRLRHVEQLLPQPRVEPIPGRRREPRSAMLWLQI